MNGPARGRGALRNFIAKAPLAVAASSLQGTVNYLIVLYLAFGPGLEATGTYRTLFSFFSLLGIASMLESNKVFVRSIVTGDRAAATRVVLGRAVCAWGACLLVALAYAIGLVVPQVAFTPIYVLIAALAALVYTCDFYQSYLIANQRFATFFAAEAVKYGGALMVFVGLLAAGLDVAFALAAQLGFMAVCHLVYFGVAAPRFIDGSALKDGPAAAFRSDPARHARAFSVANMLPASLEHIDKLLVGLVFGLEQLGIYTLAYSTGRFVYNTLKPALSVYHRRFVDHMPTRAVLWRVGAAFTAVGAVCAGLFLAAVTFVPGLSNFRPGATTTMILFASYGLGMVYTLYSQAFALNKASDPKRVTRAFGLANLASFLLLGAALASPFPVALVLLALQYPLREALSFWLLARPGGAR